MPKNASYKLCILMLSFCPLAAYGQAQIPTPISGPIVSPIDGNTYVLLSQSSWTSAQAEATALGGNLATVTSAADNAWLYSTFIDFANAPCNLWIGLSTTGDGSSIANYTWANGAPITYTDFAPGEPNYSGEQYIEMIGPGIGVSGMWNNTYNVTSSGYNGENQTEPTVPMDGIVEMVPEPNLFPVASIAGLVLTAMSWRHKEKLQ